MPSKSRTTRPGMAAWDALARGDVEALRTLLISPTATEDERLRSALALGNAGHLEALPELTAALADPSVHVRTAAVEGLVKLNTPKADEVVANVAIGEDEFQVRAPALQACVERGDAAVFESLVQISRDDRLWSRRLAVRLLGKLGDRRASPAIRDARQRDVWWSAPRYWLAIRRLKS